MKKILFTLTALSISIMGFGQFSDKKVKYDEVLPLILDLPSAGKPILLKEFQFENPEDISIDFQLGVVYLERFLDSDILTEFDYKYGNASNALLYLRKSQGIIDEKEIRKNQDLYINFGYYDDRGKPVVEFDTISTLLTEYIPILEKFVEKTPSIYESFTESFARYDKAHKLYTELVGEYTTYNNLLLLYNEEMDTHFEEMKEEYNQALEAFQSYKSLIADYDIGYNQELKITPLSVYRLDGLSAEINFLKEEIDIWNYASWVDETRAYTKDNIDGLRQDLEAEDIRTDQVLSRVSADFEKEEFELLDISKELLFTLRKFDLQSVIESIFLYKEVKHDLLYQSLLSRQLEFDAEIDINRKLYLYGQMINKIADADTLLNNVTVRNNPANHAKYGTLLNDRFGGKDGIDQYVDRERNQNQNDYGRYVSTVRNTLFEMLAKDTTIANVAYRGNSYPMMPGLAIDAESMEGPVTTHRIDNFDGSAFLAGTNKNKDGLLVGYVAGVTNTGRIGWLKEYSLQTELAETPSDTRMASIKLVPGGVAAIFNTTNMEMGDSKNQLVILDGTGAEQLNVTLLQSDFPRTITYIERSNSLIVTFKGQDYVSDILQSNNLTISSYNILGDLQWTQSLESKGDVVDVIQTFDGYFLVGNYNQLKGLDGKLIRSGGANTSTRAYIARLSNEGQIQQIKPVTHSQPYYINKVHKISDDCINLFGSQGSFNPDAPFNDGPDYVHLIMDADMTMLSSSL